MKTKELTKISRADTRLAVSAQNVIHQKVYTACFVLCFVSCWPTEGIISTLFILFLVVGIRAGGRFSLSFFETQSVHTALLYKHNSHKRYIKRQTNKYKKKQTNIFEEGKQIKSK